MVIISPALLVAIPFPTGQLFSEMWVLRSDRTIESRIFNISPNTPSSVYLGVRNHLGNFEYYQVYVKLRNPADTLQEKEEGLPSQLAPIFEYRLFLRNNDTWEDSFAFSFEEVLFKGDACQVSRLSINGQDVIVNKLLPYDKANGGFSGQLLFELWIYNTTISDFQYHNRHVWFWFNLNET
jgi:hypothetical protein